MTDRFPAILSVLSPQALIEQIVPQYRVGDISMCELYSSGFNDTYRIKTVSGKTFYLRAYRHQWRTLADIQYELDVLNHLKAKGFHAAQPVAYRDGKDFCTVSAPEGKRYLALFTEAPGPEITYANDPAGVARRYGQAVAHMHNAFDDFHSDHSRFCLDLDYFTLQPLRYIEPFLRHRPEDWTYIQQFAGKLRQHLEDLPESQLEKGFCHGDLQGYHANVAPDGTLTFYDFDCGGFGYRAFDLAVFLWCCRLEEAVSARWEPFLQGYRTSRAIRELDVQAVPLFVCARYLWHIGVHTQNAPIWGVGFLNNEYFDTHLKRLHQADEDYLTG